MATCSAAGLGSIYLKIPKAGTENDDHNPQRIQPRSLFDIAVGHDNIFHGDRSGAHKMLTFAYFSASKMTKERGNLESTSAQIA